MSNEDKNPDGEKNKRIEALEKMFGPKETKKDGWDEPGKNKYGQSEPSRATPKPEPEKVPEPLKEINQSIPPIASPEESSANTEPKNVTEPPFPLEKLKQNLKPELKATLKKISETVPKESVNKLINIMETNKDIVFDKSVTNVFANLDPVEKGIMSKKLDEWSVPPEASDVNASVIIAWLNKTKK